MKTYNLKKLNIKECVVHLYFFFPKFKRSLKAGNEKT